MGLLVALGLGPAAAMQGKAPRAPVATRQFTGGASQSSRLIERRDSVAST